MDLTLIALLALLLGYFALYIHIKRTPSWQEKGLVPYGPALLLKTKKGLGIMDRLSRYKRFWAAYAVLSKFIVLGLMLFITGLLLYQLTLIPSIPRENALGFEYILALPGINPIIPVVYGVVALIVCLFIHEIAHGILTKANDMDVESTGLLFFVVPIGAFVEPNNEQLQNTTKKKRTSMYAAGAATNFIFAVLFLLLLTSMMGSVESPYAQQPLLVSVSSGSPSDMAGLQVGMVITELGGVEIENLDDFFVGHSSLPGNLLEAKYVLYGESGSTEFVSGVFIESVMSGSPASSIGLEKGMIIYSVEGTTVTNQQQFNDIMSQTVPGQNISLTVMAYNGTSTQWENVSGIDSIVLGSGATEKGYMGITSSYAGMGVLTPELLLSLISNPYSDTSSAPDFIYDTLRFLALPFSGLSPLPAELTWVFDTGYLGSESFWFIANTAYWIFWMNFMVATTNCLPAVPLDGGFIFMDWMDSLVSKLRKKATEEERRRIVSSITTWLALVILFSVLFMFIGPRLF